MRLRVIALITTLALGILLAPPPSHSQPAVKVARVGLLLPLSVEAAAPLIEAFRQGLRDLGYVEGQTIAFEGRFAAGRDDRLRGLAAELVNLKVDVILTHGTPATLAAKGATGTIPIVTAAVVDPVGTGIVASLGRPGGNITGLTSGSTELSGKSLELLKELVPGVTRVAVLWNPANPVQARQLGETRLAGQALRLQLQALGVSDPKELDSVFAAMTRERAGALLVIQDLVLHVHRKRIVELAAKSRLPAMYERREWVDVGGLMSYGVGFRDNYRRVATFVDKILKGAKPADLPVEHPTRFELVINLRTAKALGLKIPQSILIRADQMIE